MQKLPFYAEIVKFRLILSYFNIFEIIFGENCWGKKIFFGKLPPFPLPRGVATELKWLLIYRYIVR